MTGIPILSTQAIQGPGAPSIQPMQSSAPGQIAQAGQALQGFGLEVAQAADRMQDELDESAARQALRDLAERQRAILRDPATGYLGTAGANAIAGRQAALDALKAAQDDVAGTLASQQAQALFRRQADLRMQEAAWDVDGHAGREQREFDRSETSAAIDLYADEAVDWFGKSDPGGTRDETYRIRRASALEQFDRLAALSGVPQDSATYQGLRRKVTGKIAAGVTAKLLEVDADKAWDFLRKSREAGDMDPDADRVLTGRVREAVTMQRGQSAAAMVFDATGGNEAAAELLLQDAGLPPDVLRVARAELKIRGDTAKAARDQDSAAVLDDMKAWAIRNPWADWREWEQQNPERAAYASQNGLLDEVVEYFASDKRGADNPRAVADLESMPDDFWRDTTPQQFAKDYALKLSPKAFAAYQKRLAGAKPGAPKPTASNEDGNKLALHQGKGITFLGSSMTTESSIRLLAFNAEVDRLVAALPPGKFPEAEAFAMARQKALLDYAPGSSAGAPKWRWEAAPEDRAAMPGAVVERGGTVTQVLDLSGVTATEVRTVLQSLGSKAPGDAAEARIATVLRELESDPNLDPRRRDALLGRIMAEADLPAWVSPNDVARGIVEKRTADRAARSAERGNSPGMVSVEALARSLGTTPDDVRSRLAARSIDVADDDLAYGDAQSFEFGEGRNRLTETDQLVGISRAAADRFLEGVRATGAIVARPGVTMTTADAQTQVRWLESFADPDVPKRIEELLAAQARFQAQFDALPDDEKGSPFGENLQQQAAMLGAHARYLSKPDRAEVEAAWDAWLQQGGEVYEGELGEAMRTLPAAPVQPSRRGPAFVPYGIDAQLRDRVLRRVESARPRYAAMPTFERHRQMKALRDRLLGGQ